MSDDCLFDGHPIQAQFVRQNATSVSSAAPINLQWTAPFECVMEQLTAHWSAVPTTSQNIVLTKDATAGAVYDTVLRSIDPSTAGENTTDIVCIIPFRFTKGDIVKVTYANTDNRTVGVEIMLRQIRAEGI